MQCWRMSFTQRRYIFTEGFLCCSVFGELFKRRSDIIGFTTRTRWSWWYVSRMRRFTSYVIVGLFRYSTGGTTNVFTATSISFRPFPWTNFITLFPTNTTLLFWIYTLCGARLEIFFGTTRSSSASTLSTGSKLIPPAIWRVLPIWNTVLPIWNTVLPIWNTVLPILNISTTGLSTLFLRFLTQRRGLMVSMSLRVSVRVS